MAKQMTIKTQYGLTVFDSNIMDLIYIIRTQAVGVEYYDTKRDNYGRN